MYAVVSRCTRFVTLLVAAGAASVCHAGNWPAFRGADGRSVTVADERLPLKWGPGENVRWRVELPGKSNGSPIVWGDRVFVAQALEPDKRRTVMCFDRTDGKLLWQSGVAYAQPESTHPQNPYCSGTPATDGERVVACFGSAGLYCYDMEGKELWHRDLGKLNHMFGNAISPLIVSDLVVLNYGPGEGARLVAVDKHSGSVAWESKPPEVDPVEKTMGPKQFGGPGVMILVSLMAGDKDKDSRLSLEEMAQLADAWFDKLDPQKTGKVTKEQFVNGMNELVFPLMPPPPGTPALKAGPMVGPGLFADMDGDHDGVVTRAEMEATFRRWYGEWGHGSNEPLDGNQIVEGLNAIVPPPKGGPGSTMGGPTGPGGSWATPLLLHATARDELVVSFPNRLAAYDPRTGAPLWICKGLPDAIQPMPVWDEKDGVVVAFGQDMSGGTLIAVRPGGSGDVTDTHRVWRLTRLKGAIGTGVAHDGRLFVFSDDGFAVCYDLSAGKKRWQKRLPAAGDRSACWSSALLAGERIYVPNQSGEVFVLNAGPQFELVATNSVNEPTNASLAVADAQLFLRTDKALWCIGK